MKSLVSVVFLFGVLLGLTVGFDMFLDGNAVRSQPLKINMDTGTIITAVVLTKPDGTGAGTCLAPNGGVGGACSPDLSQDMTNGITTFNIASVSRTTDQGVWTSEHGVGVNGNINITVLTIPTLAVNQAQSGSSIVLSSTTNAETLTIAVTCAYPQVFLNLVFKPQGGGPTVIAASSTYLCTSTGNTGCSDTDANSYTCTITPQYEASLVAGTTYNMHVTVNLDGQFQSIGLNDTITDTDITVQGTTTSIPTTTPGTTTSIPTTTPDQAAESHPHITTNPDPNPDCPCTGETVLLSLSIAIMCMVLMHAWLVFLFTKGIIKWNIPTVSKCDNEKSPVNIIVVTIAISLCCVVGMVLCAVGMSICQKCTSSDDNTGLILAIVGFVLVVVGLVVDILYVCIFQKKTAKCDQRNRPDGQEDNTFKKKETLPPIEDKSTDNSARSRGRKRKKKRNKLVESPTSASKIQTKINKMSGQVSDSNESDGGETARSKLGNVPVGRKLPPLQPGAEQSQPSEDTTGVKKLKKKKKKKNKEEQKNDKEDDNE